MEWPTYCVCKKQGIRENRMEKSLNAVSNETGKRDEETKNQNGKIHEASNIKGVLTNQKRNKSADIELKF